MNEFSPEEVKQPFKSADSEREFLNALRPPIQLPAVEPPSISVVNNATIDGPLSPLSPFEYFNVSSIGKAFDSASLDDIVAAVEREPQISREERLRQLRSRAGVLNPPGGIEPTSSNAQSQRLPPTSFLTGSLPSLSVFTPKRSSYTQPHQQNQFSKPEQTLPHASGLFGSFMAKAHTAAAGVMRQANVVVDVAKHAANSAVEQLSEIQQPQPLPAPVQKGKAATLPRDAGLSDLTPPVVDEMHRRSLTTDRILSSGVLFSNKENNSEYLNEEERREARRAWGQSSSMEDVEFEGMEVDDDDQVNWNHGIAQQEARKKQDIYVDGEDEQWLPSEDNYRDNLVHARDARLMGAASTTSQYPEMDRGHYYDDGELDELDQREDDHDYREDERYEKWQGSSSGIQERKQSH